MRQPGWDEPAGVSGQTSGQAPRHTGLVEPEVYPQQPLPPAGWRPVATERRTRAWEPTRREVIVGLGTVAVLAVAGLGVAWAWLAVAPRLGFRVVSPGNGVPVVPEAEQFFAADGWFTLLTLAVGALAAVLLWRLRSTRGPAALVALALGGLAGAVVTWRFGAVLAPAPSETALRTVGRVVYPALRLRALSALVVEPIAAIVTYLLFTGFAVRNDLGREDGPPEPDPNSGGS
jgi:hypothetical protein